MQLVRAFFIVCIVSALLSAPFAFAQKYLFNRLDLPTGAAPQGVAVGDFNKDGISDFAVANSGSGTISVYLGKVDGTFQAPATLATGSATSPTAIVATDFNLDGKIDLAATLNGANNVMVFPGTGTGIFNTPLTFSVGTGPTAMIAADFNKDKKLDLAVVNNAASSVSILTNNSTTSAISFTAGSSIAAGLGLTPTSIVVADFNGDTKLDLAVGSAGDKEVSVMLGTGTGTFGAPVNAVVGQNVYSVAAADFDKDGKLDLIAGTNFSIGVKLGNGDGTFGATTWPWSPAGAIGLYPIDLNGDKKVDVIAVNYNTSDVQTAVTVLINSTTAIGNPTFVFPPRRYGVGYQPRGIAVGDFNFDAKTDVLVAAKGSNIASVLLGDGKGHFDPGLATAIGKPQCQFLAAADFNNDHKTDIAITCMGGNVQVFLGKGTGLFNAPITLTAGAGPQDIATADFNGDGFVDLAVANRNSNDISVFMNNKAGGFNAPVNYATGSGPTGLVAGNFTLGGHVDLAVINTTASTLQVFPGTTGGTFGTPASYPVALSPQGIVAGDFNSDGKLDLAVAAVGAVSVLVNNAGTFPTRKDYTISGQPTRIATASLRNNGVLDLVTTLPVAKNVAVLLGKNDGTFATPVTYPTMWGGVGLSIADFNADGFLDGVVATGDPVVTVHLGKGDGTLRPLLSYHVGAGPNDSDAYDIAAVDVNNDGFTDFVTADYGDATYAVYLNTPVAALRPAKMNFGTLLLGATSAAQTATMYNSGIATLKPKITLTGTDYTQTANTCGVSLVSGASCSVSIVFSPKDINARAAALNFADNATVTPQKVSLTGVGSEVGMSPNPVTFGPVVHGTTTTKVVTITNLSGGSFPAHALTFTGIAVSGTGFSLVSNGCPPSTSSLPAGGSCQVTVKFAPATTGSFSGLLTLTDNGGGSPQKIKLTGSGT
jgi:FG-GAP-like repeat/Abnormal spindle-like microcephaly-assoc'd, ASPM-SPD-2-Hydin